MASLYDFGAKSSFNQWDITGDRHTRSSEWAWNTLWVPLFHLRLYSPWMLVQVPHKLLQDICDGFFRWPLLAVAMSVQARDSIRALRQLMSESRVVTPGAPAEKEDCVLALMLEATSELLEIGGTMREEQLITVNYGGYDIPRYVPLSRTKVMCEEVIGVIMREDTTESIATSPSVLHTIAPYYGTVCQRELQALALPYRRSTDAFHRPRADALLRHLSMDVPPKRLCCIGVVAGTPDSGPSGVFLDHYRGPWAAGRTYDSSKPFMILVAEDSYCNLRWVAVSDMGEAGYDPIVVPAVWGGRPLYITRARARLLEKGRLSVVAPEDVRGEMESDVHVLCGDMICCPAFWMTRTTLVHAVTGHEQANELVLGDVFRAVSQLRCPCERTWAKYYGD
ncbi:hypothetical protein OE88DRAFT_1038050 [Heliocybe sulcata]|uniref:Uncharacterized protein n=1 Tax=Heliocybe sulcata TaxID=5364 RepID=A0A5C3MLG7_9AGAM|nr:hypothetical protein OE88DRAFT_1038050 [Heliocybe sulcata]